MPRHLIAEVLAHEADHFVSIKVTATSVPKMVEGFVHNEAPQSKLAPSLVTLVACISPEDYQVASVDPVSEAELLPKKVKPYSAAGIVFDAVFLNEGMTTQNTFAVLLKASRGAPSIPGSPEHSSANLGGKVGSNYSQSTNKSRGGGAWEARKIPSVQLEPHSSDIVDLQLLHQLFPDRFLETPPGQFISRLPVFLTVCPTLGEPPKTRRGKAILPQLSLTVPHLLQDTSIVPVRPKILPS